MVVKINGTRVMTEMVTDFMATPGSTEFLWIVGAAFVSAALNHYLKKKGGKIGKYDTTITVLNRSLWIAAGAVVLNAFLNAGQAAAALFDLIIR